jgi:hypothetical protein
MRPRRIVGAFVIAVAAASCGGRVRPTPAPTAGPPPQAEPPRPTAAATSPADRFAFLPGPAAYDVRTEATIEMTAGPTQERGRETVTTSARVDYEVTPGTRGVALKGQVTALAVQASSRITGGAPMSTADVRVRGTIDARGARLDVDGPTLGCATPEGAAQAAALAAARETVIHVPATIAVGTRWRDSASVATCRGPITGTASTSARYEVTGIDGNLVHVRRETTTTLRGGGFAGGKTVSVSGGGTGAAAIDLDAARGRLVRLDGESRTTVSVGLPDGARQFVQQTRTQVRRRDGA